MEQIVQYNIFDVKYLEKYTICNTGLKVLKKERFPFQEVSKKELMKARLQKKPTLILKQGEKLYICTLPEGTNLPLNFLPVKHLCSSCDRCSAADDEKGGCQKVRDFGLATTVHFYNIFNSNDYAFKNKNPEEYKKERKKAFLKAVSESRRIEKYPFITYGLETIHMRPNPFIVLDCEHFKAYPSPKYINKAEALNVVSTFNQTAEDFFHPSKFSY